MRLYRAFRAGGLVDLMMLDTRGHRDRQITSGTTALRSEPRRTLLGPAQERWLFAELRRSARNGTAWRLLGQQILFAETMPGGVPLSADMWDGYPAARARMFDFLDREQIGDVAILTGDLHSSWAIEVPADPWAGGDAPARRSRAVEFVTPAISSAPLFADAAWRDRALTVKAGAPHVKYVDGAANGYLVLDVTRDRLQADWYFVPTVQERTPEDRRAASFVCERGSARLSPT
jgi:alkaline phosphatase D